MSAADIPEEGLKSKLHSTGSSLFYRAVGRETKPAWGNRIMKDFYDLDYDVPTTSFQLAHKFSSSTKQQYRRLRQDIERSKLQRRKAALPQSQHREVADNRSKTLCLRMKRKQRENP